MFLVYCAECLSTPYFPWEGFGRPSESLIRCYSGVRADNFCWFLQCFATYCYCSWLIRVSTFLVHRAEHFSTPHYHYSGVPANIFGDFCNFLRPNDTLGGWKGSQPSRLFLPNNLVCNTCHQRALGGHRRHYSIITVVSLRTFLVIFAIFCVPMVL